MSDYDEPIVTSRNALVSVLNELQELKAAVRWLRKHTVECGNCQRELSIADEIEYWCKYNYWNDEDHKHAQTLLKVLEEK